jgi:hypothetical protein
MPLPLDQVVKHIEDTGLVAVGTLAQVENA